MTDCRYAARVNIGSKKARDDFAVFSVELAQGRRGDGGDAHGRRLHRAAGTQAGGPHSESLGTQPRRPVRPAAAARRRRKVLPQRRHHPTGRLPAPLSARADHRAWAARSSPSPSFPSAIPELSARATSTFSKSPTSTSACSSFSASLRSASTASPWPAGRRTTNIPCSVRCALRRS